MRNSIVKSGGTISKPRYFEVYWALLWAKENLPIIIIIIIIIYIRQSQQTEVFLLGALNDYEDARGKLAENRRSE